MEVKEKNGLGAAPLGGDRASQATFGQSDSAQTVANPPVSRTDSTALSGSDGTLAGFPNEIINVINLATEATNEVESLVRHIDGIVKQVPAPDVSAVRIAALEREAKETARSLVTRRFSPPEGVTTDSLDATVRRELEQTLGRTLDFLLP